MKHSKILFWLMVSLLLVGGYALTHLHANAATALPLVESVNTPPLQSEDGLWQEVSEASIQAPAGERKVIVEQYRTLALNGELLRERLAEAPLEFTRAAQENEVIISLPLPDGTFERFRVVESPMMEPELAAKWATFKTYSAQGVDQPSLVTRFSWTEHGFHALIVTPEQDIFIDAYRFDDTTHYISYDAKDLPQPAFDLAQESALMESLRLSDHEVEERFNQRSTSTTYTTGPELLTYRIAVAGTGGFTANQGGTVADGLAKIVERINDINGYYETQLAMRFILVANNDQLVFTDPDTDPYTDSSSGGGAMLGQNQATLDSVIGDANYDIGHVFAANYGGGLAGGRACNAGSKGKGLSGSNGAVYLANHELGHQFSASHTFNSNVGGCSGNRSGSHAYEPGAGNTVMSYGSSCSPENTGSRLRDFHVHSFDQIRWYATEDNGALCPGTINTGNNTPTVEAGSSGFTIPYQTPFSLTGAGSDPDGQSLLYSWEQMDLGPLGHPNEPQGNAPLFRWFPFVDSPTRLFPRSSDIINNTQTQGEILPSYSRSLTFRLRALDNQSGGGGVVYDDIALDVTDQAGPFRVIAPNSAVTWQVGALEEVAWDVSNTNFAPVSCATVNLDLSTDGGNSFPVSLAANVANDGSHAITVTDHPTTTARLRVACATYPDHFFFDISNTDFTIETPASADFSVLAAPSVQAVCAPNNAIFEVNVGALGGFGSNVALSVTGNPAGTSVSFGTTPVTPAGSSQLTISGTGSASAGNYELEVSGVEGSTTHTSTVQLALATGTPNVPTLASPANEAHLVSTTPIFSWQAVAGASSYDLQIATDANLSEVLHSIQGISGTSYTLITERALEENTVYYWRVRANNACGTGSYSTHDEFDTGAFIFQNNTISGMTLWLDGDDYDGDGTADYDSGRITNWTDKSGNSYDAIIDYYWHRPILTQNIVNGRDAVSFDGSNDRMVLDGSILPTLQSMSQTSLFAVIRPEKRGEGVVMGASDNTDSNSEFYLGNVNSSPYRLGVQGREAGTAQFVSGEEIGHEGGSISEWYLLDYLAAATADGDGHQSRLFLDGAKAAGDANQVAFANINGLTHAQIGQNRSSSGDNWRFGQYIGEVILFERALSTDERQQIEGYLAHKWGQAAKLPNDHPYKDELPTFSSNQPPTMNDDTFSLDEGTANDTLVGSVSANDPEGHTLAYTITAGNSDDAFAINAGSGQLTVNNSAALVYASTPTFNVTVVVTDSGTPSRLDSAVITINLNDINLNPLVSDQSFKIDTLSSNNSVVGTVIASDPDPSDTLTYGITAGNTGTAFDINSSSGQLTVNDNTGFTTNPPHVYPLTVQLTDNGSPNLSSTATVTVTVTNCPTPNIVASTADSGDCSLRDVISKASAGDTITFDERIKGQTIHLASEITLDKNLILDGGNQQITLSGDSDNNGSADVQIFSINSSRTITFKNLTFTKGKSGTGAIYVSSWGEITIINSTFADNISTYYSGAALHSKSALNIYNSTFSNNSVQRSGQAQIISQGGSGHLTIVNSTFKSNSTDATGKEISNSTSSFTLKNSIITGGSGAACAGSVTPTITSNNLVKDSTCGAASTAEPKLGALQNNGGSTPTHGLLTGSPAIDAGDNTTCAEASTINNLDQRGYTRSDGSCDIGAFERDGTPTFGSNDAPTVTNATFSIQENSPNGTSAGTVTANDANGDTLSLRLFDGNTNDAFAINPSSGEITVNNQSALNFDSTPQFILTVDALDDGTPNLTGYGQVIINLQNINVAPIITDSTFTLDALTANGTSVGTVEASDSDIGDSLTYAITGGNTGNAFTMTPNTNEIMVADNSNFNSSPTYVLSVQATDNGTPPLSTTGTITVTVTNCPSANIVASVADSGDCSLRDVISKASAGDTITFDSRIAGQTIHLADQITITKGLTLEGGSQNMTISGDTDGDGSGNVRVFEISDWKTVVINKLTITKGQTGNQASASGVNMKWGVNLTLNNVTFSENVGGYGGAIKQYGGTLTVRHSTFINNTGSGGGAIFKGYGNLNVYNSTFSGNDARWWGGGAISNSWGGNATLINSTFSDNTGSEAVKNSETMNISNTIIANSETADCAGGGAIGTNSNNLIEDGSCNTGATNFLTGDPKLAALADNGGSTQTHALQADSPAIDGGDSATCAEASTINNLDQRGEARDDLACDIGAFELKLTDSTQVSKTVSGTGSYTFGPTMAELNVTDTGGCLTGLTLNQTNSNHPNAPSGIQTGKYWSITPTGCTSGFSVNLTMSHAISPESNARLCRYDTGSSTWDCDAANNSTSATSSTVTRSAVTQFSDWAVGDVSQPLAVNLANFAVTSENEELSVRWQTINELNNLGFNLYRNNEAIPPTSPLNNKLIPSQAPGSGQGMSYEWIDNDVQTGLTYYYWLESVDVNGEKSLYGPVSATVNVPTAVTLQQIGTGSSWLALVPMLMLILLGGVVLMRWT